MLDKAGQEIGEVDDLLVDEREHKVRFLRVVRAASWVLARRSSSSRSTPSRRSRRRRSMWTRRGTT